MNVFVYFCFVFSAFHPLQPFEWPVTPWLPWPDSLHSFQPPLSLHIHRSLLPPLWRSCFLSVSHQTIISLHTTKTNEIVLLSLCLCPQCVRPAARNSWSRGWGKTGSSSFCWGCSWLWSAGSWTTPSPSAKKVGKRQRVRKSCKDRSRVSV